MSTEKNSKEEVRTPWVPMAVASKWIAALMLATILLTAMVVVQSFTIQAMFQRKPWIVGYKDGRYQELNPSNYTTSRDSVETFLSFVIPSLYGNLRGQSPNLTLLNGLVNSNIIREQMEELRQNSDQMEQSGTSQMAIITGLNPETLVINRAQKFVYAEALGTVIISREDKATPTQIQWRCLIYIVEPLSYSKSDTPTGEINGNEWGLYLQQIMEQSPGTLNEDSPKPTTSDEQEKQEQELKKEQEKFLPTLTPAAK